MFQVQDMPYTINGKKVEIVIKKMLSGKDVQVSSTVANPECLPEYRQYRDVEHVRTSKL
jgi:acetoacetyl-CoA synthetase